MITEVPEYIDLWLKHLRSLSDGHGKNMLEFGRQYNPETKMFRGVKLAFSGRVTRAAQQRLDDVFEVVVAQADPVELHLYESDNSENCDSDSSDSVGEEPDSLPSPVGSDIEDAEIWNFGMTEDEEQVQKDLFKFFNSLIAVAVDYIKVRFAKFRQQPLNKFQEVFNVSMFQQITSKKGVRRFGRLF